MGGASGRLVQSSDSPMFASSGYKCNYMPSWCMGKASRFEYGIKGSIQGFYRVPGKDSSCTIDICMTQSVSRT